MNLWDELKRRNVVKVAVAYMISAWVLTQVASTLQPVMNLPEWATSFVVYALLIGFPVAMLFAWAFELTPDGVKKTAEVDADDSIVRNTGQKINYVIIGALVLLVGGMGVERFFFNEPEAVISGEVEGRVSIAVLPFADMSEAKDQGYFTDGISEELLNVLARVPNLKVAARTSSFAFKGKNQDIGDIAKLLKVDHVLEGSIRKSGNKVRITAQLIKADDGYHMWSDTYDRELDDIFAVQDEISAAILGAMKIHLLGEAETILVSTSSSTEAYEQFLYGRNLMVNRSRDDINAAVEYLKKSVLLDPDYAPAQAWLGLGYLLLENSGSTYGTLTKKESKDFAKPHVDRALKLEPKNAEALAIFGLSIMKDDVSFEEAAKYYEQALAINPNLTMAYVWLSQAYNGLKREDDSLLMLEKAYEVDPLSLLTGNNLANDYIGLKRYSEAQGVLAKLERFHPRSSMIPESRANIALLKKDYTAQIKHLYQALSLEPNDLNIQNKLSNSYYDVGMYERSLEFGLELNHTYIYTVLEDYAKVASILEVALAKEPTNTEYLANATLNALDMGDRGQAEGYFARMIAEMDENPLPVCNFNHFWTMRRMGEYNRAPKYFGPCDKGIEDYKKLENPRPEQAGSILLGLFAKGDYDQMMEYFNIMFETGFMFDFKTLPGFYEEVKASPAVDPYLEKVNKAKAERRAIYQALEASGEIPNPLEP